MNSWPELDLILLLQKLSEFLMLAGKNLNLQAHQLPATLSSRRHLEKSVQTAGCRSDRRVLNTDKGGAT